MAYYIYITKSITFINSYIHNKKEVYWNNEKYNDSGWNISQINDDIYFYYSILQSIQCNFKAICAFEYLTRLRFIITR